MIIPFQAWPSYKHELLQGKSAIVLLPEVSTVHEPVHMNSKVKPLFSLSAERTWAGPSQERYYDISYLKIVWAKTKMTGLHLEQRPTIASLVYVAVYD